MSQTEGATFPLVAVAVDKDKASQSALKWALDNIVTRGHTITLIHVINKHAPRESLSPPPIRIERNKKKIFVFFSS